METSIECSITPAMTLTLSLKTKPLAGNEATLSVACAIPVQPKHHCHSSAFVDESTTGATRVQSPATI